ncbi:type I restriction-modification system subunit M [Rhizobium sp. 57MFTsu3.2]|uniref:type I restriction-modification system subunit M n=1 Tax=Rhizobium sp. 57MFTsu3.2 TaxID=1048681 RepID=UPI001469CAFD|nr:type I restriction-modification system subunit M [Rhizobium sp. 57MFTsu3.2]NMN71183.1 type I restriction enzyme M protein [Rhizobium sp. 57MFTsu3.2]
MTTLTLSQLETHLWRAADILRGSIDSGDYKHYIFGLLFFKRLSDVWEEEYEERLARYRDADLAADPDEHRFDIPKGHFWRDVRKHTTDIGTHLNAAFRAIEDANMKLRGVFQDVDFNNKERFPDARLEKLLQHFETYRLRNLDVEPDVLGQAYEYLIAQFADDAGKKGGEFYTPKMVVRLIVECLKPEEGMSIYDPTCGSGGMLLEAVHHLERQGKNPKSLSLFGQERNLNTWAICQMNLFLHDIDDAAVARGDTLLEPKHLTGDSVKAIRTFDRVLANPPFSLKSWGHDMWSKGDAYGRDRYGCPPKSYGDLAFVQHMVASLKEDGVCGVVLPHGVLFRGGAEGKIREGLIKDDLVEAVIGLAPNLFYGAGIPACVLILRKQKSAARKGKTLFIHAADEFIAGKKQNLLTTENLGHIVDCLNGFKVIEQFSYVADYAEIEGNNFSLNIPQYVDLGSDKDTADIATEYAKLLELRAERNDAEAVLDMHLRELGYGA